MYISDKIAQFKFTFPFEKLVAHSTCFLDNMNDILPFFTE